MTENRRQILEMTASGKITADEAERLILALEKDTSAGFTSSTATKTAAQAKYLRIIVESAEGQHHHGHHHGHHGPTKVNIRIPMQLLRAGVKLASLIPIQARAHINEAMREHGVEIDLTQIKPENLEELIDHMNDLTVDVDETHNKVKIFCE